MDEKWLNSGEYIILEGNIWTWVKAPIGRSLSKTKVYLTNQRLYGKDSWTRIKLFDFPLSAIYKVETTKKHLRIEAEIKGKKQKIDLSLKNMDENWEWMIKERIKTFKRRAPE